MILPALICPTCGREMEPKTHAISVYSTLTILTCPICLTTPEPEPITESETFAFRERVDARLDVNRVACGRLWR